MGGDAIQDVAIRIVRPLVDSNLKMWYAYLPDVEELDESDEYREIVTLLEQECWGFLEKAFREFVEAAKKALEELDNN